MSRIELCEYILEEAHRHRILPYVQLVDMPGEQLRAFATEFAEMDMNPRQRWNPGDHPNINETLDRRDREIELVRAATDADTEYLEVSMLDGSVQRVPTQTAVQTPRFVGVDYAAGGVTGRLTHSDVRRETTEQGSVYAALYENRVIAIDTDDDLSFDYAEFEERTRAIMAATIIPPYRETEELQSNVPDIAPVVKYLVDKKDDARRAIIELEEFCGSVEFDEQGEQGQKRVRVTKRGRRIRLGRLKK